MDCADITQRITLPDPLPADWAAPSLRELLPRFPGFAAHDVTMLAAPCADALPNHAAFGRCELSTQGTGDDGRRFEITVTLLHYRAGVVERDRRPRECEDLDGEWEWLE